VSKMSNLHLLTADERAETAETELAYVSDLNRELMTSMAELCGFILMMHGKTDPLANQVMAKAQAAFKRAQEHADMQLPPTRSGS
jgi:hypothetical protein